MDVDANIDLEGIIREAACGFVSRLIASIPHPGDPRR